VRVCNHRKRILSLPECGSGRTKRLGTNENDRDGESELDGGISVQVYTVPLFRLSLRLHSEHSTVVASSCELPVPESPSGNILVITESLSRMVLVIKSI